MCNDRLLLIILISTHPHILHHNAPLGLNATLGTRHLLIRPPAVEVIGHLQAFAAEGRCVSLWVLSILVVYRVL